MTTIQAPQAAAIAPHEEFAQLVLIRGEGMEGLSYPLPKSTPEHYAGRQSGAIHFPDDHYLSPRHACFFYQDGALHVRDEGSLNGIYLRLRGPYRLQEGDTFLVGEELLRILWQPQSLQLTGPDGTHFFAPSQEGEQRRIAQIFEGGRPGLCYTVRKNAVVIGRENCDLEFPHDRFISGQHCLLSFDEHGAILNDLNSRNGTYVRIQDQQKLSHGDYLFVGKQLLRVEFLGQEGRA